MLSDFWHRLISDPALWAVLTIPPVTAFVTWAHVGMALAMLFYPIQFWGLRIRGLPMDLQGLGWQGIVPAKAGKISGVIVDQTLSKLGSLDEFFQAMNPEELAELITKTVDNNLENLIDEIMMERTATLWNNTPYAIKRRIYTHAHSQMPTIMKALVLDLTQNVETLVDMRRMIVAKMESDRRLMVNMFLRVGKKEIKFIWKVSAVIGFLFGLVQMVLFYLIPEHWTVPFFATIWGALTNWIAIWMVFNPVEPVKIRLPKLFCFKDNFPFIRPIVPCIGDYYWQGGFMKRQAEVSAVFADIVVSELVTLENIMHEMMYGFNAAKTRTMMKSHLYELLEAPVVAGALKMVDQTALNQFKDTILDKSIDATMIPISDPKLNQSRADKIYGLFKERLLALTPNEFQNLLRPAFKEDEMTLVILGGITGFLAGWLHLVLVFF